MRLIDADAVTHEYYKNPSYLNLCTILNHAPTIDAVPVVRCKECKHREDDKIFGQMWCRGREVNPEWFCADGERKQE